MTSLIANVLQELPILLNKKFMANTWVYGDEGQVYIRVTKRVLNGNLHHTIDVATVDVDEEYQGKGVFRSLLQAVEEFAAQHERSVFLESVLNEQLLDVLPRYGYQSVENSCPPCFVKTPASLRPARRATLG